MPDLTATIGADANQYNNVMGQLGPTASKASNEVSAALAQSTQSMTALGGSTLSTSMRFQQMRSGTATLRDGLIGVAVGGQAGDRALLAMGHHLTTIYNETGSVVGVLSVLKSSLLSFGGVILVISAAAEIWQKYSEATAKAKYEQTEFQKAVESANSAAGEEISKLSTLYDAATNDNLTRQDRLKAVRELQKEFPGYFGNLTQEAILAGKAAVAYDALTQSIVNQAVIKAGEEQLQESLKPLITLIAEQERLKAKLDKDNADAQKNNPAGTQVDYSNYTTSGFRPIKATGATNQASIPQLIEDETKAAKKAGADQIQTVEEYRKTLEGKIRDSQDVLKKMVEDFGVNSLIPVGEKEAKTKQAKTLLEQYEKQLKDFQDQEAHWIEQGGIPNLFDPTPLERNINRQIAKIEELKQKLATTIPEVHGTTSLRYAQDAPPVQDQLNAADPSVTQFGSDSDLGRMQKTLVLFTQFADLQGKSEAGQRMLNEQLKASTQIISVFGKGFESAFEGALNGTQSLISGLGHFLEELVIKLLAAAAAAALLDVLLAATGFGAVADFSSIFGQLSGFSGLLGGGSSGGGGLIGFADGGIVTGPVSALIGEGSESEAVLPLSKLNEFVNTSGGGSFSAQPMLVPNGLLVKWNKQATKSQNRRT